jgi:hypothetical protein
MPSFVRLPPGAQTKGVRGPHQGTLAPLVDGCSNGWGLIWANGECPPPSAATQSASRSAGEADRPGGINPCYELRHSRAAMAEAHSDGHSESDERGAAYAGQPDWNVTTKLPCRFIDVRRTS